MKDKDKEQALRYALYFVLHQSTVRGVAKEFGVSKSHVHNVLSNMSEDMFSYDYNKHLVAAVKYLLEKNKSERHVRGGNATKQKYIKKKQELSEDK